MHTSETSLGATDTIELDVTAGPVVLTQQLCNIPSESGDEKRITDAIEHALALHAPHLAVSRDGDAIVASTRLNRPKRILIAGHLDTVPIKNNVPVYTTAGSPGEGEMIWGRGTVDMKAGVAVQLALAVELTNPVFDVTWIWYDNEEVDAHLNGLARVLYRRPALREAELAILGEPSRSRIEAGCNGTLTAKLVFSGRRAHTARSWKGVNAIHRMADTLTSLKHLEADSVEIDGLTFHEGVQAVAVHSGVAGNVVPDRAELKINYRFAPNKSVAEAEDVLRSLTDTYDEFVVIDSAGGAMPDMQNPAVRSLLNDLGDRVSAKQGWTDVARFQTLGIPAINFGPGDPLLAHADDERVSVAQIEESYSHLKNWLTDT